MFSYYTSASKPPITFPQTIKFYFSQGWGVAVLAGVPGNNDAFKTHPMNFLNERTLKGTAFGNYKPRTDLPTQVEKYMKKVSLCFNS